MSKPHTPQEAWEWRQHKIAEFLFNTYIAPEEGLVQPPQQMTAELKADLLKFEGLFKEAYLPNPRANASWIPTFYQCLAQCQVFKTAFWNEWKHPIAMNEILKTMIDLHIPYMLKYDYY